MTEETVESENLDNLSRSALLEKAIRGKFNGDELINILVFGKYKVGKSTLINSLFYTGGEPYEVAREGSLDPTTDDVNHYPCEMHGVKFNMYDSPGLQDGKENDATHLQIIRDKCPKLHLIIYCTNINEPLRPEDKQALENIHTTFTDDFWQNLVVAMTHSDQVKPARPGISAEDFFKDRVGEKKEELLSYFKNLLEGSVHLVENVNLYILPTSTVVQLQLPDIKDWREDFWEAGKEPKQSWKNYLSSYATVNTAIVIVVATGAVALLPFKVGIAVGVGAGGAIIVGGKKAYELYDEHKKKGKEKDKNA